MLAPLFTLAIFAFTGLASSSVPELTCAKGTVYHVAGLVATRCCGGHHYQPGYQRALEEHFDSCNKEPAEKTETLAGIQWILYACLMEHLVGRGEQATFKSVAEAMAGNITEPEKVKILQIVENSKTAGPTVVDWSNRKQVESTWTAYFDAEFEICKDILPTLDHVNTTTARELYWEPSFMCKEAKLPYIIPFKGNFIDAVSDCAEKVKEEMKLNATTKRRVPTGVCLVIITGALKTEDLRTDKLDVDAIINKAIPKTLSSEVISEAMKSGKLALAKNYEGQITGTETLSEMAEKIAGSQKMANIDEYDKKFYSNAVALDAIVHALADGVVRNSC